MWDFIVGYFQSNYILIFLSVITLLLLIMKPKVGTADFRPMYITVGCILLCTILDRAETLVTDDSRYYVLRLILSVFCYWLRPAFCLGLLYVIETNKTKRILILIPELINIFIMGLAFIPFVGKWVFYFDENFCFTRGPLGYTVFIIGFIYVFILLAFVVLRLRRRMKETWLLVVCSFSIIFSSIAETGSFLRNVTSTLVISSCLVYYLMIYIQLTSIDDLTGLYNQDTFRTEQHMRGICAVASIDMNGLKALNDTKGHEAGNLALAAIGKAISHNLSSSDKGYRTGGDEFTVMFRHKDENAVASICRKISDEVTECGYSIALGYAFGHDEGNDALITLSDQRMYEDKNAHYAATGQRR